MEAGFAMDTIVSIQNPGWSMNKRLAKLLRVAPFFIFADVAKYIQKHPDHIAAVLLEAQQHTGLTDQQFLGVILASVLVEGRSWLNISLAVRNNPGKEHLLERLQS